METEITKKENEININLSMSDEEFIAIYKVLEKNRLWMHTLAEIGQDILHRLELDKSNRSE